MSAFNTRERGGGRVVLAASWIEATRICKNVEG
jgi:hypothetical protein